MITFPAWVLPSFLSLAGFELGDSFKLPGSHIPCMGTSFLHVSLAGVELGDSFKLPGSHIPCMGTSLLLVLLPGAL